MVARTLASGPVRDEDAARDAARGAQALVVLAGAAGAAAGTSLELDGAAGVEGVAVGIGDGSGHGDARGQGEEKGGDGSELHSRGCVLDWFFCFFDVVVCWKTGGW